MNWLYHTLFGEPSYRVPSWPKLLHLMLEKAEREGHPPRPKIGRGGP